LRSASLVRPLRDNPKIALIRNLMQAKAIDCTGYKESGSGGGFCEKGNSLYRIPRLPQRT
jgi:hypothetical protein